MIKKAVLPVAGIGTRFLPASKATPKEMLPIIDKPLVQYAVEEAIEIGIDDLNPDPSFGSHFFQNISNLRIGYFTISKKNHKKFINWDLIENLEINNETKYLKHFALEEPLFIKIDGKKGMGAILKNKPSNLDKMNEEESTGI